MSKTPSVLVEQSEWTSFFEELSRESDRATAILAAAWIDHLLQRKLGELFPRGNAKARTQFFGCNGPFSTFSSKIAAGYCIGWLDADVHHDLGLVRKIRNLFAHKIHGLSMESPEIRRLVESFRVPYCEFYDWGTLSAAATPDGSGFVLWTGEAPGDVGEPLVVPASLTFRLAASWTIAYLAADLGMGIVVPDAVPPRSR